MNRAGAGARVRGCVCVGVREGVLCAGWIQSFMFGEASADADQNDGLAHSMALDVSLLADILTINYTACQLGFLAISSESFGHAVSFKA